MSLVLHAVMLRDRGVRVERIGDPAADLARPLGLEERAWLVASTPHEAFQSLTPAPGTTPLLPHPTLSLVLSATTLSLHSGDSPLASFPLSTLPEDWYAALLRQGGLSLVLTPEAEPVLSLPHRLSDLLSHPETSSAFLALRLPPPPSFSSELADLVWEKRSAVTDRTWSHFALPTPPPVSLPSSPLPSSFSPTLRHLLATNLDFSDLAADTVHLQEDSEGLLHFSYHCAENTRSLSLPLAQATSRACPRCGPSLDLPLVHWPEVIRNYTLASPLRLLSLASRLASLQESATSAPGYDTALALAALEVTLVKESNPYGDSGRTLPGYAHLAARTRTTLAALLPSLRADPTPERALLLARFGVGALSPASPDHTAHAALADAFSLLLSTGLDPTRAASATASRLGAPLDLVSSTFATWLTQLDRGRLTLAGPPTVIGARLDDTAPANPVLRLAFLRWPFLTPPHPHHGLTIVPRPVAEVLHALSQDSVDILSTLWRGEDASLLTTAAPRLGKYWAHGFEFEKAVKDIRTSHHLLAPHKPVSFRPFDAPVGASR